MAHAPPSPQSPRPLKRLRGGSGEVPGMDFGAAGNVFNWSWPARVDEIGKDLPDCLAVTDGSLTLTWSQLSSRSKAVAAALRTLGLTGSPHSVYPKRFGDVVNAPAPMVVMLPHAAESLILVLGVLRQGFPVLPLSITHGNRTQLLQRYEEAMSLFEPVAAITDSPLVAELQSRRPALQVISAHELLAADHPRNYEDVPSTTEHALAYMFTSGSTGQSKCVCLTNCMAHSETEGYPELFSKLGYRVDPHKDRWRIDHEMGWWGAAFFGEVDVALAMRMGIVLMKPTDPDWGARGITVSGALPSQLSNLWPGARNIPPSLKVVFSWAERCDVELGATWKAAGVRMADLLIATEYFLTFASCNLETATSDGRSAHAMRPLGRAKVYLLDESFTPIEASGEASGLLGVAGPQVTPGYVERLDDGSVTIGSGPLSQDMFKVIDGDWVAVPKDIMKKQRDRYISVGRGGGTVKVKGGVLMATNVAEVRLEQGGAVASACITDPLHVEGGSTVVLELRQRDAWTLRDSLQQAGFLRLPVLFTRKMLRNASTGKVQKSLLQEQRKAELELELQAQAALHQAQDSQVAWYLKLARRPLSAILLMQGGTVLNLGQALLAASPSLLAWALVAVPKESVLQLCLVSWTYGAFAQAGNLGRSQSLAALCLTATAGALAAPSWLGLAAGSALLGAVAWKGPTDFEEVSQNRKEKRHLVTSIIVGLGLRLLPFKDATWIYSLGMVMLFAWNRRLPSPPNSSRGLAWVLQRVASHGGSMVETLRYLVCFPVLFVLALPSIMKSEFQDLAWNWLSHNGVPIARKKEFPPCAGPAEQMEHVQSGMSRTRKRNQECEAVWVDTESMFMEDVAQNGSEEAAAVVAETPVAQRAQQLARQAGVDFRSVDSLRIARLSILLKKHMRPKSEALEFNELREACTEEHSFLQLAEERLEVMQTTEAASTSKSDGSLLRPLQSWLCSGARIHREGATNAPWDCQVDVLLRWDGAPLNLGTLHEAVRFVQRQHPMLRARPPLDDSTDLKLGCSGSGFSTTVAATWSLLCEQGAVPRSLRKPVAKALFLCWPRTAILEEAAPFDIPVLSQIYKGGAGQCEVDEVYRVMNDSGWEWWNATSALNMCLIKLETDERVVPYLYCSITHKYADGGAIAAFVHALEDTYQALARGDTPSCFEHPILEVQQQRLRRYLSGAAGQEGAVDMYLFDIVNDTYYHKWGHSVGVQFTPGVCETLRMAGQRMACSEEIAWLSCIVAAMFRMLPDKLLRIMVVHNGRMGDAEGAVACTSNYVMLSIPCLDASSTPLADIASRVKYAITHGKFRRPTTCEQAHARINIGGMIGKDGDFTQVFKTSHSRSSAWSRAPYVIQLRMDNEGGIWCVKDFKCHEFVDPTTFWTAAVCIGKEIAEGAYTNPVEP
ncbi:agiA [Symbiodinium natans]|uniref:AgiA protein n=1 Tax=Symbiodinium natans TaxID=878477 RepID=A0A812ND24_9DINO|nr:agiA [Symbiodinium natans]